MQRNELQKLGNHIKKLRKERKLTISALCYKNGLEPSTISRIEKGQIEPKYLTLLNIAKAFNLTLAEFLNFQNESRYQTNISK